MNVNLLLEVWIFSMMKNKVKEIVMILFGEVSLNMFGIIRRYKVK